MDTYDKWLREGRIPDLTIKERRKLRDDAKQQRQKLREERAALKEREQEEEMTFIQLLKSYVEEGRDSQAIDLIREQLGVNYDTAIRMIQDMKPSKELEESISHWESLVEKAKEFEFTHEVCSLCNRYYDSETDVCSNRCPVKARTGEDNCSHSPYSQVLKAWSTFYDALQAEKDFLEELNWCETTEEIHEI